MTTPRRLLSVAPLALLIFATTANADVGHVAVVVHDGSNYDAKIAGAPNEAPRQRTAHEFYSTHSDSYDFLVVFPTFAADLGAETLGLHHQVSNDVSGIGMPNPSRAPGFDFTARLRGYIDTVALHAAESPDTAVGVVAHEIEHQWAAAVKFVDPQTGAVSLDLLGYEGAHWSFFLDSDASVLLGSKWRDDKNGTFTAVESRKRYSALDLYLMGMLSPAEVPDFNLLRPLPGVPFLATDIPPPDGTQIQAVAETISINNIIAAEGPRTPAFADAPHEFRAAFIILAAPGEQPTADQIAFVDSVRRAVSNDWFILTRGRGVMETELVETPPGTVASNPSASLAIQYLLAQQKADGSWGDSAATTIRDTQTAIEALAVAGTDPQVTAAIGRAGTFLQQTTLADGTDPLARRILGLSAAHLPVDALVGELIAGTAQSRVNDDSGLGYTVGYGSSVLDTALWLKATASSSTPGAQIISLLLGQQASDGGWPFFPGGPGRIEATSRVLDALSGVPDVQTHANVSKALTFLQNRREPNGLYADDVASAASTALASLALIGKSQLSSDQAVATGTSLLARQRADGSWDGSSFQTAEALKALRALLVPNLAIGDGDVVLSSSSVNDGELVLATVTIHNRGFATATGASVGAFDSNSQPYGVAVQVPDIVAGATATVSLSLDTTGHSPSSQVFIVVDPNAVVDETSKADNRVAKTLQVLPPPQEPDFYVASQSMVVSPSTLGSLPGNITVSAQVGNLGLQPATGVKVGLLVDGVLVATQSIDLPARSLEPVVLSATVTSGVGVVPVLLVADVNNQFAEANEQNNSAVASLTIERTVDVAVSNVAVTPSVAPQGTSVAISFTVTNLGTAEAFGALARTTIRDAAGNLIATLAPLSLDIPSRVSIPEQVTWKTSDQGTFTINVAVEALGDVNLSNNTGAGTLTVQQSSLPNLTIRPSDLQVSPSPPLEGQPLTVLARVSNQGAAAGPFAVDFFIGDPQQGGQRFGQVTVPGVAANGFANVSAQTTLVGTDSTTLVVVVDSNNAVAEFDEQDNVATMTVKPLAYADLVLVDADIVLSDPFPRQSTTTNVTVMVQNAGDQRATGAVVELFDGSPEAGGASIGGMTLPTIEPGEWGTASFTWSTGAQAGEHDLVAIANRSQSLKESRYDNNRGDRKVPVQNSNLALSYPFFSPNGDGIQDATDVQYRLAAAATVEVRIADAKGQEIRAIQSGAPAASGSVTWDGRDSQGSVVADGAYGLTVLADATPIGQLTAVVDNNAAQLEDAAGTALLLAENLEGFLLDEGSGHLQCPRPGAIMPDGLRAVISSRQNTDEGCAFNLPEGLFLKPLGGGDPILTTLSPFDASAFGVSPSGNAIAVVDSVGSFSSGSWLLWSPDILTRLLIRTDAVVFSPDSDTILVRAEDASSEYLELISADGSTATPLAQKALGSAEWFEDFRFDPAGRYVSYIASDWSVHIVSLVTQADMELRPALSVGKTAAPFSLHQWVPGGKEVVYLARDPAGTEVPTSVQAVSIETGALRTLYTTEDPSGGMGDLVVNPVTGTVGVRDNGKLKVVRSDGGVATLFWPTSSFSDLQWSLSGTAMGVHVGESLRNWGLSSLANLTVGLTASRISAVDGIVFSGTAADANFDNWELSVQPVNGSSPSRTLARSTSPVVQGTFFTWRPSAAGAYRAELVGKDKAGNVRKSVTTVAWPDLTSPSLSEIARSPELFSPNGDGVLDTSTVTFNVNSSVTTELAISDSSGAVIRDIVRTYLQPTAASIVWDGTDASGKVVGDGKYTGRIEGMAFDFETDTTPPATTLRLSQTVTGDESDEYLSKSTSVPWTGPDGKTGSRNIARVFGREAWQVTDEHPKSWSLMVTNPMVGDTTVQTGTTEAVVTRLVPAPDLRGRSVWLLAEDGAGNVAISSPRTHSEHLFVTAIGNVSQMTDEGGSLTINGQPWPRVDLLQQLMADPLGWSASVVTVAPGPLAIVLDHSIASQLVAFSVAVGSSQEVPVAAQLEDLLIWDASSLTTGFHDVELRAIDQNGRRFSTSFGLNVKASAGLEACSHDRELQVGVSLKAADVDSLPRPGGQLSLIRAEDDVVERVVTFDATFGPMMNGGWGATTQVALEGLQSCAYRLELVGTDGRGEGIAGGGYADVCGVFVNQAMEEPGGKVGVVVSETAPGPMGGADLFWQNAAGVSQALGSVGPFSDTAAPVEIGLDAFSTCGKQAVRVAARTPDGAAYVPSAAFKVCNPATVDVPCASVSVSVNPQGTPTTCVRDTGYQVELEATAQPGHTIQHVSAQLVPVSGSRPPYSLIEQDVNGVANVHLSTVALPSSFSDGAYRLAAQVRDDVGLSAKTTGPVVIIDNTPPQIAVSAPARGAVTCSHEVRQSNGAVSRVIDVAGALSDAQLVSYVATLNAGGAAVGSAGQSYPSPRSVSLSGTLAQIAVEGFASGDYTLSIQAVDASGCSTASSPISFELENADLAVEQLVAEPAVISPDGDGRFDLTTLHFVATQGAQASLTIDPDEPGATPVLQGAIGAGAGTIEWNGMVGGTVAADGSHVARVDLVNGCGLQANALVTVVVDTIPPVARIDAPTTGSSAGPLVAVMGEASDANFGDYQLEIGAGDSPTSFSPVISVPNPSKGLLGTVPTAGLSPGNYTIRLVANDQVGHTSVANVGIVVPQPDVIAAFNVSPSLISPNGDGVLDWAQCDFVLLSSAQVTLEVLNGAGATVALPMPAVTLDAGSHAVRLDTAALAGLSDGMYQVRLTAAGSHTALAPLGIDTSAPQVAIDVPVEGATVSDTVVVKGRVADTNLTNWILTDMPVGGPAATVVAQGNAAVAGELARLSGLAAGSHQLTLSARDAAGNEQKTVVTFGSDRTALAVRFLSPLDGAFVSGRSGAMPVRVAVTDQDLKQVELRLVTDAVPSPGKLIATATTLPADGQVGPWNVAAETDGHATLIATATTKAGTQAQAQVSVTIDNTGPVARIDSPNGTTIGDAPLVFKGAAQDANFAQYTVEIADAASSARGLWESIATGTTAIPQGNLASLGSLPADGHYTARLKVRDLAGNESVATTSFAVDSTPPAAPTGLSASVDGATGSVHLSWQPNSETDLAGYRVYRAPDGGTYAQISTALVTSAGYVDQAPPRMVLDYQVTAVDALGHESQRSAPVRLNAITPLAAITQPMDNSSVSGVQQVVGTAYSDQEFLEYRLLLGAGASPVGYQLVARGSMPVRTAVLGAVDFSALPQGATYVIRLEAENTSGTTATATATVKVDNIAPGAPILVSAVYVGQQPTGNAVNLTWQKPADSDVAGYLVYRNGSVANAPAGTSFADLRTYLIPATQLTYRDLNAPDGTISYQVQAADSAMNLGPLSNTVTLVLDHRVPSAKVVSPARLAVLSGPVDVVMDASDLDVAQVQLKARQAGTGTFVAVGSPVSRYPYRVAFDARSYSPGAIELEAVATDRAGKTDQSPATVIVLYQPGLLAPTVHASVDGDTATLSWTDSNLATQVAGYQVQLDGSIWSPTLLPSMTATASSSQTGAPARYAIDGNTMTAWTAQTTAAQTLDVLFASPFVLQKVQCDLSANSAEVLVRSGGIWVSATGQLSFLQDFMFELDAAPPPMKVDGIRLAFPATGMPPSVKEIYPQAVAMQTTPPAVINSNSLGHHSATVVTLGSYGSSAMADASFLVYRPTLDALPAATGELTLAVSGEGAKPLDAVALLRNGVRVAEAIADAAGGFGGSVPLASGSNVISAIAEDAEGNRSLESLQATVEYAAAPVALLQLTLDSIVGSDVSLSWTVQGDTSDASAFELTRSSAALGMVVRTVDKSATSFADKSLPGDTYTYSIAAVNSLGIPGTSSNSVTASISTPLPPPPGWVQATAAPEGGRILVSWQQVTQAAAYQIEHSTSASGPFSPFETFRNSTSIYDQNLANGVPYYYRVRSVDAAHRPGDPSMVASAVPRDTVPPNPPEITEPAGGSTRSSPVTVAGQAEPGAVVSVLRNGLDIGTARASSTFAKRQLITSSPIAGGFSMSSDGSLLAYIFEPSAGAPHGVIVEDSSGVLASFVDPNLDCSGIPRISQMANLVVVECATLNGPSGVHSHIYTGSIGWVGGLLSRLNVGPDGDEHSPQVDDMGTQVAYEAVRPGAGATLVGVADLSSPGQEQLFGDGVVPAARPVPVAGVVIAVVGTSPNQTVTSFDLAGGGSTDLFQTDTIKGQLVSAAGLVAFVASDQWSQSVVVMDPSSGAIVFEGPATDVGGGIGLSSSGAVAFASGGALVISGAYTNFTYGEGVAGDIFWSDKGIVSSRADGSVWWLDLPGRFALSSGPLDSGWNTFVATAADSFGNVSGASDAEVFFDTSSGADLAVTAQIVPALPLATDAANAWVTVQNHGAVSVDSPDVSVEVIATDGAVRLSTRSGLTGTIPAGGQLVGAFPLDVHGLAGWQKLKVVVDPAESIADGNRSNNSIELPFYVASIAVPSLVVSVAPSSVTADGAATAAIELLNPGDSADVVLSVVLASPNGDVALPIGSDEAMTAAAWDVTSRTRSFNVGATLPGTYDVVAQANGGGLALRASAPLTIEPKWVVGLTIAADRSQYDSGAVVTLASSVTNQSPNAILEGAEHRIVVTDSTGATVFSSTTALPTLALGVTNSWSTSATWPGAGNFDVRASVALNGTELALASTKVVMVPRATLAGTVNVSGGGTVPRVLQGLEAAIDYTVTNEGAATANALAVAVNIVDPDTTTAVWQSGRTLGSLASGSQVADVLQVPTAALALKTYAVSLTATHDGGAEEILATARFRVADSTPPILAVTNLTYGMYVQGSVTPQVHASDSAPGVLAVTASVDGQAPIALSLGTGNVIDGVWTGTLSLAPEGPHSLVFAAADGEGNVTAPIVLGVVSDTTVPQLSITGVAEGALVNAPVVPVITATDANLDSVWSSLNGASYVSGTPIAADGDFVLVATAIDKATNRTTVVRRFSIDRTPPLVMVLGVGDGAFVATDVLLTVVVSDLHPGSQAVTLDGAPFAPGSPVSAEGPHSLHIVAQDAAGNTADQSVHFIIDKTAPTLVLGGFADGEVVATSVTPTITASDTNLLMVTATLDGKPFASGTAVILPGTHVLVAVATDKAGNQTQRTGSFTIESGAPEIVVSGVVDGEWRAADVVPVFGTTDTSPGTVTATLTTGASTVPFVSGTRVTAEGSYVLEIHAVNSEGLEASRIVHFGIDRTAATITVTGVTDGQVTTTPVTPTFTVSDANLTDSTATLLAGTTSGPFTSGTTLTAEQDYVLTITAHDRAGNTATSVTHFAIDRTAPTITISGVKDGDVTNTDVTPTIVALDAHLGDVTATLDDGTTKAPYTSGTKIAAEHDYILEIIAKDRAGNSASATVHFAIDRTAPQIVSSGATDGEVRAAPVAITFDETDAHPGAVTATINDGQTSQPYLSGTQVTSEGDYQVTIVATDAAGNSATQTLHFAIDLTAPIIQIAGVVDGQITSTTVVPIFSATDAHPASTNALLDGLPFASGTPVSNEGFHTLLVTAIDEAGNQATKSVSFTIDRSAPVIAIYGVVDGEVRAAPVTIDFTATDSHLADLSASLTDGSTTRAFVSGTTLTAEADYILTFTATDTAGNQAIKVVHFAIDLTAPAIVVSGVSANEVRAGPVTPTFTVTDKHPATTTAILRLGGVPSVFSSGTTLTAEGDYQLEVDSSDAAGNTATKLVPFAIDTTAPSIVLAGFTPGGCTSSDVTPVVSVVDAHPGTQTITLDGASFASGTAVSAEALHTLVVNASDAAGNHAGRTATFTIDKTAPVITITGVQQGQQYQSGVAATVAFSDANLTSTTLILDGIQYQSGTPITAAGQHLLAASASDCAGNQASQTVLFSVQAVGGLGLSLELVQDKGALVALGCQPADVLRGRCNQKIPVLASAIAAAGMTYELALTDADLVEKVRENRHRLFVLYRCDGCAGHDHPHDWGGWHFMGPDELSQDRTAPTPALEREPLCIGPSNAEMDARELKERIWEGAGLLEVTSDLDDSPDLADALGVWERGSLKTSSVNVIAIAPAGPLTVGGSQTELSLRSATAIATALRSRWPVTVAASNAYGAGRALTVTFDPELAPSARMTQVLAALLEFAGTVPSVEQVPLSPEIVGLSMWSQSSASLNAQLVVTLPTGSWAEYADPAAMSLAPPTWRVPLAPQQTWDAKLGIQLADSAGPANISAAASWLSGGSWQLAAQANLAVPTARTGAQLQSDARAALQALKVTRMEQWWQAAAIAELGTLNGPAPTTRAQAEPRIDAVLDAIDATREIRSVDVSGIRLTLDALLRYWELRWTELPQ